MGQIVRMLIEEAAGSWHAVFFVGAWTAIIGDRQLH
jgi:hypothetical protein